MWSNNSTTFGLCYNTHCMCHTAMVPCLGTSPMTQYWYNNVQLSSTTFPNYQSIPENTIFGFSHASNLVNPLFHVGTDQAAGEQMTTSENDSWLLPNLYNNQIDGSMNLTSYSSLTGNQDDGQFDQMLLNYNESYGQSSKELGLVEQQGQALNFSQNDYSTSPSIFYPGESLLSTGAGNIAEATIGTMSLQREWALGVHPGNLVQQTVGSQYSNSTLGTQQLASRDDFKPSSSRQERILRYFKKKKSRKYEKKMIYSSRKIFARTRPRVRGRFAKVPKIGVDDKVTVLSKLIN